MSGKLLNYRHFQDNDETNEGTMMCRISDPDILLPLKAGYGEWVTAMPQDHAVRH
ncbi:hypothetical protein ACK6D9_13235 [Hoeflea sp. Naph1]|uniref:hypothetical protein n=1 Tax=Hoeflea sp. Naph1 TaxID=3388653 RepID=UPI0039902950